MTAERITVDLRVTYGDTVVERRASVAIDDAMPWTNLGAAVVAELNAVRSAMFDLVDRDRQASLAAEAESEAA